MKTDCCLAVPVPTDRIPTTRIEHQSSQIILLLHTLSCHLSIGWSMDGSLDSSVQVMRGWHDDSHTNSDSTLPLTFSQLSCILCVLSLLPPHPFHIPARASRGPFLYVYQQVTDVSDSLTLQIPHVFGLSMDTSESLALGRLSETGDEQSGGILSPSQGMSSSTSVSDNDSPVLLPPKRATYHISSTSLGRKQHTSSLSCGKG